jgi:Mg-chelatase subunit ChlD
MPWTRRTLDQNDSSNRAKRLVVLLAALAVTLTGLTLLPTTRAVAATTPAVIAHAPVATSYVGRQIDITATTTCEAADDCPLALVFRTTGGGTRPPGAWQRVDLTPGATTTAPDGRKVHPWSGSIPAVYVDFTGVDYYLESVATSGVVRAPDGAVNPVVPHYHVHTVSPPMPQHVPTPFAVDNKPIDVELRSTCSTGSCAATLYYRTSPTQETLADEPLTEIPDWPHTAMTQTAAMPLGDAGEELTFTARIPASVADTRGVDYFMLVEDGNARAFWPGTTYQGYLPTDGVRTGYMHVHVLETPHIVHAPVLTASYRQPIPVTATANCPEDRTCEARLYWRTTDASLLEDDGTGAGFDSAPMTVSDTGAQVTAGQRVVNLAGTIPASVVDTRGVDYFFSLTDGPTTAWWPGTSQVDGYLAVPGTRVGYQHIRVLEPPRIVPTTAPATHAGKPFKVTIAANCATQTCDAELFYAQQDLTQAVSLEPTTFTRVSMTPTGTALPSPLGNLTEYAATIPADDVTTRGLLWYAHVTDGYTNAYAPGTSYNGAYIPIDGSQLAPAGYPSTGLVGVEVSFNEQGTAGTAAFPVRVLEPPHVAHVPAATTPRGIPVEISATSNCAYPCVGTLRWLDAEGRWQSETLHGTKNQVDADGLTPWSFTGEIPEEGTTGTSVTYQLTVGDGYVEDNTPTFQVSTDDLPTTGIVTGRLWYEKDGDGVPEPEEPVAPGTVVRATPTALGAASGLVTRETTTNAKGRYAFRNLLLGDYKITVPTPPPGGGVVTTSRQVTVTLSSTTGVNFTFRPLDSDGDLVPDAVELAFGLDPAAGADTDGDGLRDAFEIQKATGAHDPAKADTDGDGIPDGAEDVDGDGLTALQEQHANGSPLDPDTDADTVGDALEIQRGTRLDAADSDEDQSPDAAEERHGTDPLNPDTDGDGILDGDEVTTSTTHRHGAAVTLVGHGDLGGALTIEELPADTLTGAPGQVSEPIHISLPPAETQDLDHATLTLAYEPDSIPGDASDLRVFTWNTNLGFWVPAGTYQHVDAAAATVTTALPHFSVFAVFDIRAWRAAYAPQGSRCVADPGQNGELDVAFVLDSSGSMSTNDPNGIRKSASIDLVNSLLDQDRGTVIDFDSTARIVQGLTSDKATLTAAINTIDDSGGTNIGAGVQSGLTALAANTADTRSQTMVLLTDGEGAYDTQLTQEAAAADIQIFTIGLGSSVDANLLRSIAEGTGGAYFAVSTAEDLPDVMEEIAAGDDSDGDGLSDCQEIQGARDGQGRVYTSDPQNPDTDDDGLTDGQEITNDLDSFGNATLNTLLLAPIGVEYLRIVLSDPGLADSEGDGVEDPLEYDIGTEKFLPDSDFDGLDDFAEINEFGTNPLNANSDGDNRDDGWEIINESAGFDPNVYDEEYSKWRYASDFLAGGLCPQGWSFCEIDSVAFLAGSLAGGFALYKDALDFIGGVTTLDFVGAGISAVSLVPYLGDAVSVVSKSIRFLDRVPLRKWIDGLAFLAKADSIPRQVRIDILKVVDGTTVTKIRNHGMSDAALLRFVEKRIDFRILARSLDGAEDILRSPALYKLEKDAENYLRANTPGALLRQIGFKPPNASPRGTNGYRYPDIYSPSTEHAIEVKNGYIRLDKDDFIKKQVLKDADLIADLDTPIRAVTWHFFPNVRGSVGLSDELRELLQEKGIPYVIHLPGS